MLKQYLNGPLPNKTSSLGSACQGIDQGPEFGVWLGKFLDKEHLNFKLIWHNYSNKTSSRELRPLIDELRPMTKQEDLPLFANFYGFLLVNEESVTSLNQALKSVWQYRSQSFKLWGIVLNRLSPIFKYVKWGIQKQKKPLRNQDKSYQFSI